MSRSGGHDVPLDKIQSRYERAVRQAVLVRLIADELWLFDNTIYNRFPRHVARYVNGQLQWADADLPGWAKYIVAYRASG